MQATELLCISVGVKQAEPDTREALLISVGRAAASVRASLMQLQATTAIEVAVRWGGGLLSSSAAQDSPKSPDAVMTNWAQLGHDRLDFGLKGPVQFCGHFGYEPSPVTILPDGNDFILAFTSCTQEMIKAISTSPVLNLLL